MQPSRQPKRGKRHGTSVSTVNIGLNYGLQVGAVSGAVSVGSSSQRTHHSDDLGLSIGNPPRLSNRSLSSGLPKSKPLSPTKQDRPTSGDSFFVGKSEDQAINVSTGKLTWQASNSYTSKRTSFPASKPFQGASQNFYQIAQAYGRHKEVSSPVHRDEAISSTPCNIQASQSNSQFYLPGDRVIFTEAPTAPGIPIVYRILDERQANPDKLNLDRRGLTVCPIVEGEDNLRLLNFQHNLIKKIENLSNLRKLIFLDLYDNHVEEVDGLSSLRSLRVLMLGKNRIRKIENLNELLKLDVLDLHGNKISEIENISHLKELRVLNLAGNEISTVQHLAGLGSLTELNLRRNRITNVFDIDKLPSLQRLFMSYNDIKRFQDISCLGKSASLTELSLDGNPLSNERNYKQIIVQHVPSLQQLDMKRITEEEKRIISVMSRKEDERRKEFEKISTLKERRQLAINNAKRQYETQYGKESQTWPIASTASRRASEVMSETINDTFSTKRPASIGTDYSVCHLAELDDKALNFYGPGSLEAIDRNWGDKAASSVSVVSFLYINFDSIAPYLTKIKAKFPNFTSLTFKITNICQFGQVNALAALKSLEELTINEEGNPITEFTLWKPYVLFRLSHLSLQRLNGNEVTTTDFVHAEKLFGSLGHVSTSQLSQSRLLTMLSKQKKSGIVQEVLHKNESPAENSKRERHTSGESVSRAGLIHQPLISGQQEDKELQNRRKFSRSYVSEILYNVSFMERQRASFEKLWPQYFKDLIIKTAHTVVDFDQYMVDSLQKIKTR